MPFIALYTISWLLHTSYPLFCKCPMDLRRSGVDILLRTERWTITCSHHSGHSWASSFTIAHNQDWEQSAVHSHQSRLSRVESSPLRTAIHQSRLSRVESSPLCTAINLGWVMLRAPLQLQTLENTSLSERNQTQENIRPMTPFLWIYWAKKLVLGREV